MSDPVRPIARLPGEIPSRWQMWRTWLLRSLPGRALVLGGVIKGLSFVVSQVVGRPSGLGAIDMDGSLAILFVVAYGITRLTVWAKRRLLWRVRRKLILSYVFVGVVPGVLIICFFLLAGLILCFNVSSYLVQSRVRSLTDQARFLAQTAVLEVQRASTPAAFSETLERRQSSAETRYPFLSIAVVPMTGVTCNVEPALAARIPRVFPVPLPAQSGPWSHLDPPTSIPQWVGCDGFSRIIRYD